MPIGKKNEIIVDREKLLEYLANRPITQKEAKEIKNMDKPKRELSEKQKAHVQELVKKNKERFQKMAEEKALEKQKLQEVKEEIVEKKNKLTAQSYTPQDKIKIPVRKNGKKDPVLPDPFEETEEEIEDESDESEEEEQTPPPTPKKKKVVPSKKQKKYDTSDSETSDSDTDIKPKKIQKMVKTLSKIDETLQKANVPVNPYINMLNRFIRR